MSGEVADASTSLASSVLDWYSIVGSISADFLVLAIRFCAFSLIGVIEGGAKLLFGTPSTDTWKFQPYPQRYSTRGKLKYVEGEEYKDEIDVPATLKSASSFPLTPEELVQKCKAVLTSDFGCKDPSVLAPDFRFVAPVVGPLGKEEFTAAFASFKVRDALPDVRENSWNFHVDPIEPNRVWWLARAQGTHSAPLFFPPPKKIEATGVKVEWPVSAQSMSFDEQGRCYQLTVGYSCDKQTGNTGGLGAVFGLLYAIGKPLPFVEGQPWEPSAPFRLAQRIGNVAKRFGYGPGAVKKKPLAGAGPEAVKSEGKSE
mmetsp:Transcript_26246/g.62150  ORF Transcript_26246/g.62150 Transcript_26246/m.62150 type:complete len:314 (-) Transcript_26246:359-1300(-)